MDAWIADGGLMGDGVCYICGQRGNAAPKSLYPLGRFLEHMIASATIASCSSSYIVVGIKSMEFAGHWAPVCPRRKRKR